MSKVIFTYHDTLPEHNMVAERILVSLWVQKWKERGFTPIVLNEAWAMRSPMYHQFSQAVAKLPSINPVGYDYACFIRWLAVAQAGTEMALKICIMADHDTFGYRGMEAMEIRSDKLTCWQGTCPSFVTGRPQHFLEMATRFANYQPTDKDQYDGRSHVSDMYCLERIALAEPSILRSCKRHVKDFGEEGWQEAPIVHYANRCCTPNHQPRYKHIPLLRQ